MGAVAVSDAATGVWGVEGVVCRVWSELLCPVAWVHEVPSAVVWVSDVAWVLWSPA